MLLYRVLSALVGIPVILFAVWYGGLPLSTVILILAVLGIYEMSRLWERMGVHVWLPGALTGGTLYVAAAHFGNGNLSMSAMFVALVIGIFYLLTVYPSFNFIDLAGTFFTSLYTGWLLTHLISLRQLADGFHYVLLVLAATWGTDTLAYFIGIRFGKHKMAPVISPNKSLEGALGGLAGSLIAAVVIGLLNPHMSFIHYLVIGLLTGIFGQAGDLVESAFKRLAAVKDSSKVIPGHGGVLDRFDSMYWTAPIVYYYLVILVAK